MSRLSVQILISKFLLSMVTIIIINAWELSINGDTDVIFCICTNPSELNKEYWHFWELLAMTLSKLRQLLKLSMSFLISAYLERICADSISILSQNNFFKCQTSLLKVTFKITMMCFCDLMNSTASLCLRFSKFFPFTSINWSPTLNPAFSAGEPGSTLQKFDKNYWDTMTVVLQLDFVRCHPCYLFTYKQYYSLKMTIKFHS